jgi:hypothetical protein
MKLKLDNAVFLDFEGFMDSPPSLAGVLYQGNFQQVVLTESLKGCEGYSDLRYLPIDDFFQKLMDSVVQRNLVIVAYTSREMSVFEEFGYSEIKDHYYDAHKVLKKWFNQNHHKERPRPFDLYSVLNFFNYPLKSYGNRQTTQRIRYMEDQLARHQGDFTKATPVAKQKWSKVLNYNRQDVEGMLFALNKIGLIIS